ncbi:MAG: MFS transporter [Proteobacteria bacterium]|nr:MFS transporter [Pseudomonadota bacterium]
MKRIGLPTILVFCLPTLFLYAVVGPALVILPSMYAQFAAVTLTQAGLIILAGRLIDVVADPLIGYWSDSLETRWGLRKPWIVAGCVVATPSVWLLFHPAASSGPGYFLVYAVGFILGFTMIWIPTRAWAAELTRDRDDRARIFTVSSMMTLLGGIFYALLPILLSGHYGSSAITMRVMNDLALIFVVAVPLSIAAMVLLIPRETPDHVERPTLRALWLTLKGNRLLWRFLVVNFLTALALGMYYGLVFPFFADHMKLAPAFPYIAIASGAIGFAASTIWLKVFMNFEKTKVWGLAVLTLAPLSPIIWLIAPGPAALVPVLILTAVSGSILACHFAAGPSVLSDVIDYGRLRTKANKTGNIFSLSLLITKAGLAGGAGLALLIAGLFGYRPGAANDALAVFGLAFAFSIMPSLLFAVAGVILLRHPINRKKQEIIRRRLEQRESRLKLVTS